MIQRIAVAVFILALATVGCHVAIQPKERWAAYYGSTLPAEAFIPYDLIVFDRQSHPPLDRLKEQHKTVLGYISLAEAETYRTGFDTLKNNHLLLDTGVEWSGNPVIDVRNPVWNDYVIEKIIPEMLQQGFDGVMLDTADSAIWLEKKMPERYAGLDDAMVRIIKNIRTHYPHIKIMLNRGFEILPRVAGDIDMVLAESIYKTDTHADDDHYVQLLDKLQTQFPSLKIYTLDYLPITGDAAEVKEIYAAQRHQGFIPYVATRNLDILVPEPK